MSEHFPQNTGINMNEMPGFSEKTTLAEVIRHFQNELSGKSLTMHFGNGAEDIVTHSTIYDAFVTEDGTISLLTEDALEQPAVLQFSGDDIDFTWSIYEVNDLWFEDPNDENTWWGIYDEGLTPGYIVRKEENQ